MEKCIAECLKKQTRKHDEELNVIKQSQMATHNLLTDHNPTRVLNYKSAEHYKAMTKASNIIFHGKPENWPAFEDHLVKEAENPTIVWSKDILSF
jgi:hypothetical protein